MKLLAEWKPLDVIQRQFVETNATICAYTGGVAVGKTGAALIKALLLGAVVQRPGADGVRQFKVFWIRATQSRLLSASLPSIKDWIKDAGKWTMGSPIIWRLQAPGINFEMQLVGLDDAAAVDRVMGADASVIVIDEGAELADLRAVLSRLLTRAGRYPAQREGGISTGVRAIVISNKSGVGSDLHKLCVTERSGITAYFDAEPPLLEDGTINPKCPTAHLSPNYYQNLAATLTPDVRAVLLENRWALMSVGRPIIPEFKSTVHVARQALQPSPSAALRLAIDPGNFPAAIVGSVIDTPQGSRWECHGELIGERVTSTKFAGMVRDWLARQWPGVPVESAVIDPVAFQPSDRDDELLVAQVYESILKMKIRPAASASWDTGVEAMRSPFNGMVDGMPAILLDPSMTVTAEALASRVCFRETAGALEKIVSDSVYKPHPWGDAFAALMYLLGSTGYDDLIAFTRAKRPTSGGQWIGGYGEPIWQEDRTGKVGGFSDCED